MNKTTKNELYDFLDKVRDIIQYETLTEFEEDHLTSIEEFLANLVDMEERV